MDDFNSDQTRSAAPAVLYGIAAAGTVLSGLLPLASQGNGKLFDGGVVYVLALLMPAGLLLAAAISSRANPDMVGLGGGAALGTASLLGSFAIVLWTQTGGDGLGAGSYVMSATAVVAVVAFLRSLGTGSRSAGSAVQWLALVAGITMSVGCTLVPPEFGDFGPSWAEWNRFSGGADPWFAVSGQLLIWIPVVALWIGAARGGRFGAMFGLGGSVVLAWFVLAVTLEIGEGDAVFTTLAAKLHPVAVVGAIAVVVLVLASLAAAAAAAPSTLQPTVPTSSVPVQLPPAQWGGDPFERHESRYWNGLKWTENVADNGVVSLDKPVATPTASRAAEELHQTFAPPALTSPPLPPPSQMQDVERTIPPTGFAPPR